MRLFAVVAIVVASSLMSMNGADAAQYAKQGSDGQAHVAHTRLAPVLMHRAFPPYAGVHVYERGGNGNSEQGTSGNSNTSRSGRGRRGR